MSRAFDLFAFRPRAFLAWAWLVLVAIGAHAMLPVGSPAQPTNGSAFSASTIEVALQPRRKAVRADVQAEQRRPDEAAPVLAAAALPVQPEIRWPVPAQAMPRAPPADVLGTALLTASTFPARGPPAA